MKKQLQQCLLMTVFLSTVFGCKPDLRPTVYELKCENLINPNAIDNTVPHFSWKVKCPNGGAQQRCYEIQVASDSLRLSAGNADLWNTGKFVSASSVMVPYGGIALSSRSLYYWRVRVWNSNDEASAWSDIARFGVGILDKSEWTGTYIGLPAHAGNTETPLLRKTVTLNGQVNIAFLHVNSLGYHEAYINGVKVGDNVLSPAVSQLNKRTITVTYDVTSLLRKGENELTLWLGTGWYKKTGFSATHNGALVKAQLEVFREDGRETVASTDTSWQACPTGYKDTGTWQALRFGGERIDARLVPTDLTPKTTAQLNWYQAIEVEMPHIESSPEMTEPNMIRETIFPQEIKQLDNHLWLVDMGKNLNGWFEMRLPEMPVGDSIVFDYTDRMDSGAFCEMGQRDIYISAGRKGEIFCNKFNHHAFRYVRIACMSIVPRKEDIRAHLIHTDFKQASSFECSDADLNAIHNMIQHTMRCLTFAGYMVDCPHLERAGYGGDGNSSTMTLQTMYDVSPLFANWMMAWNDAIRQDGGLPHVAPNAGKGGGGPYWCGFFVMAPWRTYVNYNDDRLIRKYYDSMKQWLGYVDKYTVDGLLRRWPDTDYRDWYLGDWLAPAGTDAGAQSSIDLVNNCFISQCLATLKKIAVVLGKQNDAQHFGQRRDTLNRQIHATFFHPDSHTYATGSQLDMTYPMLVGATPPHLYEKVKQQLFATTARHNGGHIGVGLVGVAVLTEWAIANKAVDYIHTMLKKRNYPGYLYMIDNGATTTWEYWSGERSHIHNCYNGIGIWFYQAVGGIRPDEDSPGYRHLYIEPQIPSGVTWAKTTKETPYGTVAVDWQSDTSEKLALTVSLPVGVSATVILPEKFKGCSLNGKTVAPGSRHLLPFEGQTHYAETERQHHQHFIKDGDASFPAALTTKHNRL
jgi:alpha-L-rhamnosidase